jgi:hypothetical protein
MVRRNYVVFIRRRVLSMFCLMPVTVKSATAPLVVGVCPTAPINERCDSVFDAWLITSDDEYQASVLASFRR